MISQKLFFGGDYNPEQWDERVWEDDMKLMNDLGVNLVSLGVFSWSSIEKSDGVFDFSWLDRIMDKLHASGVGIDMATGTASPPAWLALKHPEMLATTDTGTKFSHGGRQHYSPASSDYEHYSLRFLDRLLGHVSSHPGIVMWHANNEIGCHNPYDFGPETSAKFREWLRAKYATIEDLNTAWNAKFWSQSYSEFEEINPPRFTSYGTSPNPAMQMDFRRYSSDQLLSIFTRERDLIREHDSVRPITTNFMSMKHITALDYWKWAKEVDFISTDHYLNFSSANRHIDLALYSDLTRGFAGGKSWLIMEHSVSAVNWQPVNTIKSSTEIIRDSLQHVFRGSQGAMFFQFRQSRGGSERYHSALVPHSGTDTRTVHATRDLAANLKKLMSVSASTVERSKVAIIFDYEDSWATQQANLPTNRLSYLDEIENWFEAFFRAGINVDFIDKGQSQSSFSDYEIVIAPMMHICSQSLIANLRDFASSGGTVITTFFSGYADENLALSGNSYGGPLLDDLFGVVVQEPAPMLEESGLLSDGKSNSIWREISKARDGTEVLAVFDSGDESSGSPAITSRSIGSGKAIYVGTSLAKESLASLLSDVLQLEMGDLNILTRGERTMATNFGSSDVIYKNQKISPGDFILD